MKKIPMIKKILIFTIPTLLSVCCFFFFSPSEVSAGAGSLNDINGVESVLVKKGDTLSDLAEKYAPSMSYGTAEMYMQDIIALNDMESEYIKAGSYILLPNYR